MKKSTLLPASQGIGSGLVRLSSLHPVDSACSNPARRRFMVGAAGLTFAVTAGGPPFLGSHGPAAGQPCGRHAANPRGQRSRDGDPVITSPAPAKGEGAPPAVP